MTAEVVDIDRSAARKAQDLAAGIEAVFKWRRILAARGMGFVAVFVSCIVWLITVIDPNLWRCIAAAGYSVLVLAPVLVLWYMTAD